MIETHPFEPFIPSNIKVLILGSFPGKEQTRNAISQTDWYYGAKRNQFWSIIEMAFAVNLPDRISKEALFASYRIGVADIIKQCVRKNNGNLDSNLVDVVYNTDLLKEILETKSLEKIYCTSKNVEKIFKKLFPYFTRVESLPSPSPRYAKMSKYEKAAKYKELLSGI